MGQTKKKIIILLPDGVGLRNFAYTSFAAIGEQMGWKMIYWNKTPFDLSSLGLHEIPLQGKVSTKTNIYKRARKEIELANFEAKFNDPIYRNYSFPPAAKTLKQKIKNKWVANLIRKYKGTGISKLRAKIKASEKNSAYYKSCLTTLENERPDFLFCTNQRSVQAITPILAAQELNIPTATFIFSWDNIPKATLVLETDYYFVWSEHMKKELLTYYEYIEESQIVITGTPQFEAHFDSSKIMDRSSFLSKHNLPEATEFICFSGDDITTSPHDPYYLDAVAAAVADLNSKGYNLAILFRRCPVDISTRYDEVLAKHENLIFSLPPLWEKQGGQWDTLLPLKEDTDRLVNTIHHARLVVNLGSSMAFDFACHNKPCMYIAFNPSSETLKKDVNTVYKYVHFRSMPSSEAVCWLRSKETIAAQIEVLLKNNKRHVSEALEWFEKINESPPQKASQRICSAIQNMIA
ncbi:MAG: UDP-glycosyltransferase [Flavobacteriales bacterium]|nr:UDP-glycosyltransferase [Flavobacteriales bacterium]